MKKKYSKIIETIKKREFEKTFPNEIRKEKSFLGKLLLQENYIFFKVIRLLIIMVNFINISDIFLKNKYLSKVNKIRINLPKKDKFSQNYTLGELIGLLKIFKIEGSTIIEKLKEYNTNRNKLTHKMFDKYSDIKLVKKDAKKLIICGDKILDEINKLIEQYIHNIQDVMQGLLGKVKK